MFLEEPRDGTGKAGMDGGIREGEDGGRTGPGVEARGGR